MSLYTLALSLHVSGAIGTFVSLGIWLFGLAALRRARLVEQVRALAWLIIVASPLMVLSVVLLGLAGFEMALTRLWPRDAVDSCVAGERRASWTHRRVCPGPPHAHHSRHDTGGSQWTASRCS